MKPRQNGACSATISSSGCSEPKAIYLETRRDKTKRTYIHLYSPRPKPKVQTVRDAMREAAQPHRNAKNCMPRPSRPPTNIHACPNRPQGSWQETEFVRLWSRDGGLHMPLSGRAGEPLRTCKIGVWEGFSLHNPQASITPVNHGSRGVPFPPFPVLGTVRIPATRSDSVRMR
jgi:hypothetical protein